MASNTMHVSRHDHFALYVSDLERSTRWYQEVLGLEPKHVDVWWGDDAHFLGYGDALVALFARGPNERYSSQNMPLSNHQAFRVSQAEYVAFKEHLTQRQIAFHEMDHIISHSIYFQDPDDYWIEITTYELPSAA